MGMIIVERPQMLFGAKTALLSHIGRITLQDGLEIGTLQQCNTMTSTTSLKNGDSKFMKPFLKSGVNKFMLLSL